MQTGAFQHFLHGTARSIVLLSLLFVVALPFGVMAARSASQGHELNGRYFLIVWAYQSRDDDLIHAHTFLSLYRGSDLAKGIVRPTTISWLPADGPVPLFGAVKGHNFTLDQTLKMACRAGADVKSWGPYEVRPELYTAATRRVGLLQSGRINYSMINAPPKSMNCIVAAGDITPAHLNTGILWGVAASSEVVRHLSPYFVGDGVRSDLKWLATGSRVTACGGDGGKMASGSGADAFP
ncbi:MAG: hypothetical protein JSR99_15580 [Proteobacteria bacterium]|nr:hypothetical protein [Pseudomonadota bacterium]